MTRFAVVAVCLAGVAANVWMAWNLFLPGAAGTGRNDFLSLYAGAQIVCNQDLYDRANVRAAEVRAIGETGLPYSRLPYFALLMKPLTWLRYRTAYVVWEMMMVAALAAFGILWPHGSPAGKWILCCWSLPAWESVLNGQDVALLLLWMALAVRLLRRERAMAAGVVLALCAAKYHLVMLVPLVILAQRRWRMAAGAAAAGAAMAVVSFLVAGATWPWRYRAALADPLMQQGVAHMPNLNGLLSVAPFNLALEGVAALLVAAAVFLAARRTREFEGPLALALVGGLLVSFHTWLADCALLLPALIMTAGGGTARGRARISSTALATPVPWFLLQLPWPLPAITQGLLIGLVYGLADALGLRWRRTGADRSTPADAPAGKTG
ncbi:MAG: glycosyltransferase family 87 protein [Bryobacteraceae bacterium]|jgi:hypothetical protein